MQCIITKYHPPTNTKPARMSATTSGSSIRKYFTYDQGIGNAANHESAARQMFKHMGWAKSTDVIYGIEHGIAVYWQISYHCNIITPIESKP